jgi:hypothetical protein
MTAYLRFLAIAFVALLAATAAFTRLVDPYDYWGGPDMGGLNRFKPAAGKHLEAVKLRQVARVQPVTLLVGNSRVAVGMDPASPLWPPAARPVYNLGLPGVGTDGLVDVALRAMDEAPVKRLVFAADFVDFRLSLQDWRTWNASRLVRPADLQKGVRERVEILLSLAALTDSVSALAERRKANPATITPAGYDRLAEYNENVAAEGHAALFEQRQRDNIARYLAGPKAVRWPGPGNSPDWASLERLARECRRRHVELVLVTFPYHVDMLQAFDRSGLWPAFAEWKRGLAAFAEREGVPLYDFSRVTPETTEAVPAPGDTRTRMRWYWEAGHFKGALGERMVADLVRGAPAFGARLTAANVEAEIVADASALDGYRAARPGEAARFDRLFLAVRGQARGAPRPVESASR